jgi:serine/threonine-protein kinase
VHATVSIVESSGPSQVTVPDVVGDTESQAVSTLQADNLNPVVFCQSTSQQAQNGIVQSQNPTGGKTASPGQSVDITVASYPSCSATSSTTTTTSLLGHGRGAAGAAAGGSVIWMAGGRRRRRTR